MLEDNYGNGWDGNEHLYIGNYNLTLEDGSDETVTVCLSPGVYSPYVCDGDGAWDEISWIIYNSDYDMVLSGASLNTEKGRCNASWGNFTVTADNVEDGVRNPAPVVFVCIAIHKA